MSRRGHGGHAPAIRAAFVYGSVAKATDQSASDIDLMIISDSPLEKSVRDESDDHMTTGPKPPADVTSQRLPIPSAILSASARVKLPLITAESPIGDRTTGAMTTAPSIRIATGLPT